MDNMWPLHPQPTLAYADALPEAVAQLMVCSTCRGTGTVWAVA